MPDRRTPEDVAAAFGVSRLKLMRFANKHAIPYLNLNGAITFDSVAIARLEEAANGTVPPPAQSARARPITKDAKNKKIRGLPRELLDADQIVALATRPTSPPSGVYFLIRKDEIVYVGQSLNVPVRIGAHTFRIEFDKYHWIPCKPSRLDAVERAYLDAFCPPLNVDSRTKALRKQRGA